MGSYIYGYSVSQRQMPVLGSEDACVVVGVVRYICKPRWEGATSMQEALMTKYERNNEGRDLPHLVCIDTIQNHREVFDMSRRRSEKHAHIPLSPVFWDDPYGFGPEVGKIVKSKNRLYFQPNENYQNQINSNIELGYN